MYHPTVNGGDEATVYSHHHLQPEYKKVATPPASSSLCFLSISVPFYFTTFPSLFSSTSPPLQVLPTPFTMPTSTGFQFLPLGAIIQSFTVGDKNPINIVQGFPTQSLYQSYNSPFFGENIGRVANRIKNGKIEDLNGTSYQLEINSAPNALHGGSKGWGKNIWKGPTPIGLRQVHKDMEAMKGGESVKFTLTSEDGDQGYPGTVEATITYTTGTESTPEGHEVQVLGIEYQVELVSGAEETVINTTNHSFVFISHPLYNQN